ncbi:hypothetical protein C7974DRAFT_415488 [Boeremia exigua]|uniref:uncharacterized protein n=1 Tax=Boeremia exigua TaxID=749465 RepID=UPI001E8EECA6|nr:uncharacterized protein C7974DRAFT_415488 [Boeremia exigua]KAH6620275.1 hypothetical protein C7974DRAFT_415488 [Boeremia exigua]
MLCVSTAQRPKPHIMGSSSSKAAGAAGAAARKYPTRAPPSNVTARAPAPQAPTPGPAVKPPPQFSESKPEGGVVDMDARDPAFASRLSSLGAVQPNPHYSPTSRSQFDPQPRSQRGDVLGDMMQAPPQSAFPDPRNNPVLRVLEARRTIADEAEDEISNVGRRGFEGRKYVDAGVIQLALMRQARGEPAERIENALGIKKGRLSVLGAGKVGAVAMGS